MAKCGVVDVDVRTNKPKVKLYKDADGNYKGDGLCTYVKVCQNPSIYRTSTKHVLCFQIESVELALTIIDGSEIKPGQKIVVERAKFEMKGETYNPKLKPKKIGKKELEKAKKRREKLLAWEPDRLRGERSKRDKVIVIENVFNPSDFDRDASLILECSDRLRDQCSKLGTVKKVVVYDKHEKASILQKFISLPSTFINLLISLHRASVKCSLPVPKKQIWLSACWTEDYFQITKLL